ncbi:IclR family transcriptional regulator [Enterobacillus tribolii]|uniref:IclR family transcriptional regulator n=2 Tax=Enterobacillus tribolii TaxID=1487935 RepID=A0A370QU74_9GAMM|nr:IclR family transcriptional regulator [Enterobacillus tribolii]
MMEWVHKSKVPALSRAIAILDIVSARGHCSANVIVSELGVPKSTVYLLLEELKYQRLLTQGKDGDYRLGLKLLELGSQVSRQLDLRTVAMPHLTALMQDTGHLCHLGVLDGDAPIYLIKVESQSSIQVRTWEGKRLSLCRSSLGKCLLAWTERDHQDALIASITFEPGLPNTITGEKQLRDELQRIRQAGWAYDNEEDVANIRCISAPVFNAAREVTAAISIVGTTLQIGPGNLDALAGKVKERAWAISRALGYKE